ncbi:MAG: YbhB/YbcL family Raf kinase inhibitor-like protein [Desulfohalobiaceae bacterium]
MKLSTTAFPDQGQIPLKYAMPGAGGQNVSVPLQWSDVPQSTQSFAVSCIDPHPVANNWIHWLVINIPPETSSLPEGASGQNMPSGALELQNSFKKQGYGGPQPPAGTGEHPYVFTVYALNTPRLELKQSTSLEEFQQAIQGKVLDQAETTGKFEQK